MDAQNQAISSPERYLEASWLKVAFFMVVISLLLSTNSHSSDSFTGQVVDVADGDTVTVLTANNDKVKIRLAGIDCPEGFQAHGEKTKQYIASLDYCKDWLKLEETAKNARLGLWEDRNPMPPWEWRAEQKVNSAGESSSVNAGTVVTSPTASAGGGSIVYHGNRRSLVFHGPGCPDYNCKNCTVTLGSVQEAAGAGYRPHRECVRE